MTDRHIFCIYFSDDICNILYN